MTGLRLLTPGLGWGWLVVLSTALLGVLPSSAQTYNPNGITRAGGNSFGSAANQLSSPNGVYVDGAGNIYVADRNNYRIQLFVPGPLSLTTQASPNPLCTTSLASVTATNGAGAYAYTWVAPAGIVITAGGAT